jgi:glycerol kinase
VIRPSNTETTALGAAYLAGLAVGVWKNKSEIAKQWKIARRFKPSMKAATRKTLVSGWDNALAKAQH